MTGKTPDGKTTIEQILNRVRADHHAVFADPNGGEEMQILSRGGDD